MDHSYTDIIRKLSDSYPDLPPQLQTAARYILEHPEDVGLNSMRAVARKAGVQPATITRLSKALGFSKYEKLREPFRQRLRNREPGYASRVRDVQRRGAGGSNALLDDLRAQDLDNLQRTLAVENYPLLIAAAETLLASRRVYVLGMRGAYSTAFLFHYAYQLFRDNSKLLASSAGMFADRLRGINAEDSMLVISFHPYTQLTIDAVSYAAEESAKIIAITDSEISPAALAATHTIVTHHRSPSFYHSFSAAVAVIQALITLLVSKTGGDAVKIVEEAEKQLSRISVYW